MDKLVELAGVILYVALASALSLFALAWLFFFPAVGILYMTGYLT